MSEENSNVTSNTESDQKAPETSENQSEELIKNFKSEMSRKFGNYEKRVDELSKVNQALLEKLDTIAVKPNNSNDSDDIADLWYDNPAEAAKRIKNEALDEARKEQQKIQQSQAEQQQIINKLVSDFPELNNQNSELYQEVQELYSNLSETDRFDPRAWKTVVLEAASSKGVKPMSKRSKEDNEDFSLSSSNTTANSKRSKRNSDELDPKTELTAQLMGMDTNDPEVRKALIERTKRTNWTKYQ
jgi:hypothetical protein